MDVINKIITWAISNQSLLSTILLPVMLVWINNAHTQKMEKQRLNNDLEKEKVIRKLNAENNTEQTKGTHENKVYAALVSILFEVQTLHIELSGKCCEERSLVYAKKLFYEAVKEHQKVIAENQIFLSSKSIGLIYDFYKEYGDLMIDLSHIEETPENCKLAHPCVYVRSKNLADLIIFIHEDFAEHRNELKNAFKKVELEKLKYCCGSKPPEKLIQEYQLLSQQLRPDEIACIAKDLMTSSYGRLAQRNRTHEK